MAGKKCGRFAAVSGLHGMKFRGRSHTALVSKAFLNALTATLATLSALSGSDKRVNQAEVFMLFHVPIVLLHIFDCI